MNAVAVAAVTAARTAAAAAVTAASVTVAVAATVTMTASVTGTVTTAAVAASVTAIAAATSTTAAVARTNLWDHPKATAYPGTAVATVAVDSSPPSEAVLNQKICSGVPKYRRGSMTYAQTSAKICNNLPSGCFHHSGRNKPPPWAPTSGSSLRGERPASITGGAAQTAVSHGTSGKASACPACP